MTAPTTFERVYSAIKEKLRGGGFRPGERLEPAQLSDELNASVTPVRDALHRLTGERMIEAPRHEGFRAPLVTETTLRHLYAWHLDLLLLALAKQARSMSRESAGQKEPVSTAELFLGIAASASNPEHVAAVRALTDRLEPYHHIEEELLDAVEDETRGIAQAIEAGDRRALRKNLLAYHRRRQRLVPQIMERLLER